QLARGHSRPCFFSAIFRRKSPIFCSSVTRQKKISLKICARSVPSPLRERVRVRVNVRADALTPALSHREREKTNLTNTFSSVASVQYLPGRPARHVWDNALSSLFAPHDTPLSRRPPNHA